MIKIALADDHAILRKGVAQLISTFPDMEVVAEAGNGRELIDHLESGTELPDICIIDINMPVMNGYETALEINKRWPAMRMLALSMYDTELNIIKMLRNGASGYVTKDTNPDELKRALQQIHEHGFYHSEMVTGRMLRLLHGQGGNAAIDLNDRETQFLSLCCTELTYKEIADKMFLSPRTIDGYREALFQKLNTTSRTGLVMYALRAGIDTMNNTQ